MTHDPSVFDVSKLWVGLGVVVPRQAAARERQQQLKSAWSSRGPTIRAESDLPFLASQTMRRVEHDKSFSFGVLV